MLDLQSKARSDIATSWGHPLIFIDLWSKLIQMLILLNDIGTVFIATGDICAVDIDEW